MTFHLCPTNKVPYWSEADAKAHAERLSAKTHGRRRHEAYVCTHCQQWHVGRPSKWHEWQRRLAQMQEDLA